MLKVLLWLGPLMRWIWSQWPAETRTLAVWNTGGRYQHKTNGTSSPNDMQNMTGKVMCLCQAWIIINQTWIIMIHNFSCMMFAYIVFKAIRTEKQISLFHHIHIHIFVIDALQLAKLKWSNASDLKLYQNHQNHLLSCFQYVFVLWQWPDLNDSDFGALITDNPQWPILLRKLTQV